VAETQAVSPVKLIAAILFQADISLPRVLEVLRNEWGTLDFQGSDRRFDITDYYLSEMGEPLNRRIVSFEKLVPPESIRQAKLRSNDLERSLVQELSTSGKRAVNLDVGYLDHAKIVLASVKFAGQKIHLGDGIYADLIGRYARGRYQPFEWTFPDFRDGRYDEELGQIRTIYLRQLRTWRLEA